MKTISLFPGSNGPNGSQTWWGCWRNCLQPANPKPFSKGHPKETLSTRIRFAGGHECQGARLEGGGNDYSKVTSRRLNMAAAQKGGFLVLGPEG